MAYTPSQAPGPQPGAASTSVVSPTDVPFVVTAEDILSVLNEIQVAVSALASARGIAADLRVTPIGSSTVVQATAANLNVTAAQASPSALNANIGTIQGVGPSSYSLNSSVSNWQNHTSQLAFTANVTRS